jgi:biopolymer transport protein ExbB
MLQANVLIQWMEAGGPIMWPILICALVAVAVVGERVFWWSREARRRQPQVLEQVLAALDNGDVPEAVRLSQGSPDPVVRMAHHGLSQRRATLTGALQVAAGAELQKGGRFLGVLDTLITLAPLLGLLGTVSGIFRTFLSLGNASVEGATSQITGGIGEALIATMCGLGIAILALIPYNYFNTRLARLQYDLESAATSIEVLLGGQAQPPGRNRGPQEPA